MAAKQEEKVISNSMVPQDPYRCMDCGSQNLILRGNLKRPFTEVLREGEAVSQEYGDGLVHDVEYIECVHCGQIFRVLDDNVHELIEINYQLKDALAQLTKTKVMH